LTRVDRCIADPSNGELPSRSWRHQARVHGSLRTRRWREQDSNHRFRGRRPASSWCRLSFAPTFPRAGSQAGVMSRRRKHGRVTRNQWFESGVLHRRVCELLVPKRRSPRYGPFASGPEAAAQTPAHNFWSLQNAAKRLHMDLGTGPPRKWRYIGLLSMPRRYSLLSCPLARRSPPPGSTSPMKRSGAGC
jgi:hypothetical protein